MFKTLIGLFRCAIGKHERCHNGARPHGDTYVSKCRHCRAPMRRVQKRDWVVDRSLPRTRTESSRGR